MIVYPHRHHGIADVLLCPATEALRDLPAAQEPGADGLGEEGFRPTARERGEIGAAQNRQSGVHAGAETQRRGQRQSAADLRGGRVDLYRRP